MTALNDPELSGVYTLHKVLYTQEATESLNELGAAVSESGIPTELQKAIRARIQQITEARTGKQARMSILDSQDQEVRQNPFALMAQSEDLSPEERRKASRIAESIEARQIEDVILTITSSNDSPEMKIKYLQALEKIAESKGWFEDVNIEKKYRSLIHKKIEFYNRFLTKQKKEKQLFSGNREFIKKLVKEKRDIRTLRRDMATRQKKAKKEEEKEIDITTLPREEQIFHLSTGIVKTFADNIDALEPIHSTLVRVNSGELQDKFELEYAKRKQTYDRLVKDTVSMIIQKKPDPDVLRRNFSISGDRGL